MLDENGVYSLSECHFKQRNLASLEVQYTTNVQTKASQETLWWQTLWSLSSSLSVEPLVGTPGIWQINMIILGKRGKEWGRKRGKDREGQRMVKRCTHIKP